MRTVSQCSSMRLKISCRASSLVPQPLPFTSSLLSVLKNDSATASSSGVPDLDIDRAAPCEPRQRWNAFDACWTPWSSWKTRLPSFGGLASDGLPGRACRDLLGDAARHRPAGRLPGERVHGGSEAGPSLLGRDARDAAHPKLVLLVDGKRPPRDSPSTRR